MHTLVVGDGGATFQYLLENSKFSRHTEKTVANCDLYLDNLAEFYVTATSEELQQYNLVLLCGCVHRRELNGRLCAAYHRGHYTSEQEKELPPLIIGTRRYARGGCVFNYLNHRLQANLFMFDLTLPITTLSATRFRAEIDRFYSTETLHNSINKSFGIRNTRVDKKELCPRVETWCY